MCIPHAPINTHQSSGRVKRQKAQKKVQTFDKEARMNPDPDFVDERKSTLNKDQEKPKSWLASLFK